MNSHLHESIDWLEAAKSLRKEEITKSGPLKSVRGRNTNTNSPGFSNDAKIDDEVDRSTQEAMTSTGEDFDLTDEMKMDAVMGAILGLLGRAYLFVSSFVIICKR